MTVGGVHLALGGLWRYPLIRSTLLYVVSVAGPALLIAIAVDALRLSRVRALDTLAWLAMAGAFLIALVYPSLLSTVGERVGFSVPIGLVGFVGIVGLFVGYVRQRDRVTELESRVRELREAASADADADARTLADNTMGPIVDQGRVAGRRGGSALNTE
ncbi:MAG: DUF2304 domain-containing protein [Demequinaceae bacterium]|nr:DUF2304 domain-containing protein [Demequinaceae bacterium]